MKEDIKLYVCISPTKDNPKSHRLKVIYKDKQDHKRIKETFPRFENKKETEKAKVQWALDYANDDGFFALPVIEPEPEPEPEPEIKVLTFREYAEPYLKRLEKNTKSKSHKSDMKVLVEYFADTPLNQIDYSSILQFEQEMRHQPYLKEIKVKATEQTHNPKTGRMRYEVTKQVVENMRSDSTVNHYVKRLRHLLYQAKREKKISEKPDFHLVVKAENNKPTTAITFAEFEKLLSICTDEQAHLYLQLLCIFETGCRRAEYKAIRKRDLNIETHFCWVNISKQQINAKQRPPRRCYFSKRLIDAIIADGFDEKKPEDFLFYKRDYFLSEDGYDNKKSWETVKKLAFSDTEDLTRREKLLDLDMQRSLRKSASVNYGSARIQDFVKDYQLSHAPNTTGGKHYQEVSEELQFDEFQRYEEFSERERAKLQKAADTGS